MAEGLGISDPKRLRSLLLHSAGSVVQDLFADLTDPLATTTPSGDNEYKKATRMLNEHFQAEPNPVYERYQFRQLNPRSGEGVAQFVVRLRQQARFCNFGAVTDDMIRDHVVATISNVELKKKLLQEPKLTLANCLNVCSIFESTQRQASAMGSAESLHAVSSKSSSSTSSRYGRSVSDSRSPTKSHSSVSSSDRAQTQRLCYRCNRPDHLANDPGCPARGKRCTKCRREGHFALCCNSKATNHVEDDEPVSESYEIGAVGDAAQAHPPILIDVAIHDVPCTMEVDTGAAVSVIPESIWNEKFSHLSLQKSSSVLHAYGGHSLAVRGECLVSVRYESHVFEDRIVVVEGSGRPLFGRNWMSHCVTDWLNFRTAQVNALSLQDVLTKFPEVFQDGLGTIKGHSASLHLQGSPTPRCFSARPVPYAVKDKVEAELTRLQEEGIIKPVDHAEWASPIVTVRKKNGGIRLCADFKVSINKHIEPNQHPIPNPTDLLSKLSGGSVFSKLDLSQAYAQLPLDEQSQSYCVIATHRGLYAFTRLPFGVSSAPSIFQKTIEQLLQGIPGVVIYFDDILICGKDQQEHDDRLCSVLRCFEEAGLRLSREKCAISQREVSYLGFTISKQGLQPSTDKVSAVMNAPRPSDVPTLRSFLGLVNFFGRFIPNCSTLLHPLNELLRKDVPFIWAKSCESSFCQVKQYLASAPIMAHYDGSLPLVLECDASPSGIGAALLHIMPDQSVRPIVYVSRALSQAESHYSQIEREALAIVFAVRRLHQYVYGRRFILRTDHKPLIKIFGPHESLNKTSASRLQRWAIILAEYDYAIEHIAGKDNVVADCLSRLPLPLSAAEERVVLSAVSSYSFDPCELIPIQASDIAKGSKQDGEIALAMSYTRHGWPSTVSDRLAPFLKLQHDLSIEHDCLMWGSRVVVPSQFRQQLLQELHVSHSGVSRMKSVARGIFWWPGLDADIVKLAVDCEMCQRNAPMPVQEPVHHWAYPNAAFERIHLDYAEFNSLYYLVLVDAYSKWIDVFELGHSATATQTVNCLLRFISTFGLPKVIVTDNGPQFVSHEFALFCQQNAIHHHRTPPYHPASNGQCERIVQEVKKCLKTRPGNRSVSAHVSRFLFSYRNTPHSCTKQAPASLLFKKIPATRLSLLQPSFTSAMQQQHPLSSDARKEFDPDQAVWVHNARPGSKPKWLEGAVSQRLGPITYMVLVNGVLRQVHLDHLRPRTSSIPAVPDDQPPLPRDASEYLSSPTDVARPTASVPRPVPVPVVTPQAPESVSLSESAASSEFAAASPVLSDCPVTSPASAPPATPRFSSRIRRAPTRLDL